MNRRWTAILFFLTFCYLNTFALGEASSDLHLNQAEKLIVEQVRKGEYVNLQKNFPKESDRSLRASFLERLLKNSLHDLKVSQKGIRIQNAVINEPLNLRDAKIPYDISLIGCHFKKRVNFMKVVFYGNVSFEGSTFSGAGPWATTFSDATFSRPADFSEATFSGVDFSGATFSEWTNFSHATFSENTYFMQTKFFQGASFSKGTFIEIADFSRATFSDTSFFGTNFSKHANFRDTTFSDAFFGGAKFSGWANFSGAEFSEVADFFEAKFSSASFRKAKFSSASFRKAKFSKQADFSWCKFEKAASFAGCLFNPENKIMFDNVTDFSNVLMEWVYEPIRWGEEKDEMNIELRGLKGHLKYNETFYIALINNFKDMGWFREADDAYYTYRVERRNRHDFLRGLLEFIFLEVTFGYGVKPFILFINFLIFWLGPSFIYLSFVHSKNSMPLPSWWSSQNPLFHALRFPWKLFQSRFAWAVIHSLDTLAPGVNLKSLDTLNPYDFDSKKIICIERMQQIIGWYLLVLFVILFGKIWIR